MTAFLPHRSADLHAVLHAGAHAAVVVDLKDFFGTTFPRHLKALWQGDVLPGERDADAAGLLGGWTTRGRMSLRQLCFRVDLRHRVTSLPQGAPSSPALANLAAYALDQQLHHGCTAALQGQPWSLSRYADDIVVSSTAPRRDFLERADQAIQHAIAVAGWRVASDKTRRWRRQDGVPLVLCGLTVPEEAGQAPILTRAHRRRVRAALHALERPPRPLDPTRPEGGATTHDRARGLLSWAADATGDVALAAASAQSLAAAVRALGAALGANSREQDLLLVGWTRDPGFERAALGAMDQALSLWDRWWEIDRGVSPTQGSRYPRDGEDDDMPSF